jgi:hypothetical protein
MWTSNLVALIFTPALGAYVLALAWWGRRAVGRETKDEKRKTARAWDVVWAFAARLWAPGAAFALGLGLSAAFFVPALVESGYINRTQWFGEYYDPTQHFVYFFQLFSPAWGFGISRPGPDDIAQGAMSYQLGAAATLFSLVALAAGRRLAPAIRREAWFWGLWALVSVFLTLEFSVWAWRHLPLVPYAQFPWRYLMLAIIPLSILPATLVGDDPAGGDSRSVGWLAAFALAAILLLSSLPYLRVEIRPPTPEQGPVSFAALMRFQRTSDEMTGVTAWVDPQRRPRWSDMAELWVKGLAVKTRVDYSRVPQNRTLAVNSEDVGSAHEEVYFYASAPGQSITFNRFWYPGWSAWLLDGRHGRPVRRLTVEREDGPLARVVVPLPAGEGFMLLRFEDTPLRAAAKWLTLATCAGLALWLVIRAGASYLRRGAWQ